MEFTILDMKRDNQLLLHILKNNPKDGEVYFTWGGETFRGLMQDMEVHVSVDSLTEFTVKGIVANG